MSWTSLTALLLIAAAANGQAPGSLTDNAILRMPMEECQSEGNCQKVSTGVTLDANWRWIHGKDGYQNCYTGNEWDQGYCPDAQTCSENCLLEGVSKSDYTNTYGITTDNSGSMTLKFVTSGQYSKNVGSRTYLLDESGERYYMFKLKNKEFTFDVDVSKLPCGLNGALYFVEMEADGGLHYPGNTAGPAYGTGYCDAQCPHDIKWINGEANCEDWSGSDNDVNAGVGHYGTCCFEFDIWEANSQSSAYTNHPCDVQGQYRCEGVECGDNESDNRFDGVCDKDGCDYNHWRQGDKTYFGMGADFQVDSSKPMTVVTQFHTHDGTDNGDLVEVRRIYVQDGKVISNSVTNWEGMQDWDSITDEMCEEQKIVFNDFNDHGEKGGLKTMGESLARGHVLVMSMWDDHSVDMLWLDSDYPLDRDPSEPGVSRGPCPRDSGDPEDVENRYPDATVTFSNIKVGPHCSTFPGCETPPGPTTTTEKPTPSTTTGDNSDCPGGSLDSCISMCPENPAEIFQACVNQCMAQCM